MTTMSGVIKPITLTQRIDRRTQRLAMCWIQKPGEPAAPNMDSLNKVIRGDFLVAVRGDGELEDAAFADTPAVLILLASPAPASLVHALLRSADSGKRVYILASPGFGRGPESIEFERRRDARILVRRLTNPLPLSGFLANRGRRSQVWIASQSADSVFWRMNLTARQGEDLFRLALYLFWHEAVYEAWTGEGPLRFRQVAERPFDALPPGRGASVHLLDPVSPEPLPVYELWHAPDGTLPTGSSSTKLVLEPPSGNGQSQLASLKRSGAQVVWDNLGLPAFSVGHEAGVIEARSDRWRIRFALESPQRESLMRLGKHLAASSAWEFHVDMEIGSIKGDVLLPDATKTETPQQEVSFDCGEAVADSLRSLEATPVPSQPAVPPLALSVVYRWTVRPPHAPDKAKDDALVIQWREIDSGFQERIEKLHNRLAALEQREGVLGRTLSSLTSALLGLGSERKRISATLKDLLSLLPSQAGPNHASARLRELDECEKRVNSLEAAVQEERQKAEEGADRKKQEEAWKEAHAKAIEELLKCRDDRQKANDKLTEIEVEIGKLSQQPKPLDQRERKDLEAKKSKSRDEHRSLVARIAQLDADIKRLEVAVEKPFEYRPSKPPTPKPGKPPTGTAAFVPVPEPKRL